MKTFTHRIADQTFELPASGPKRATTLPSDPAARKNFPIASGVLDYFPDAIVALAELSKKGNDQHNPGQPLHWAREKSTDQDDTIMRHFMERGTIDTDGIRHSTKFAWRALALLQLEIEADRTTVTSEALSRSTREMWACAKCSAAENRRDGDPVTHPLGWPCPYKKEDR